MPGHIQARELRERTTEWTLWVVALASVLHATEEYLTGWQEWAVGTLGIVMPSSIFLVMNAVLVVIALVLARSGWRRPTLALVIPTATLVNAIVFHIVPTIVQRRISPGVYTATGLYLPFSSWALIGAQRDGIPRTKIVKGIIVGTVMALSVVLVAKWYSSVQA